MHQAVHRLIGLTMLIAAAVTLLPSTAHAACPDFPVPQVVVNVEFTPPRYNFNQSLAKLRQIAEIESAAILHKDQPVGLAVGEMNVKLNLKANAAYDVDGSVCARPSHVVIDMGFQNNTVYVAKELARRTCGHEEVLAHEEEHINIDRALLKEYEPEIARYMQAAVRELGTVRGKTSISAEQQIQTFINNHLQIMANEMNKTRKLRQAQHDSHAEYKRLAASCDGQIAAMVGERAPATLQEAGRLSKKSPYGSYPSRYSDAPDATKRYGPQRSYYDY